MITLYLILSGATIGGITGHFFFDGHLIIGAIIGAIIGILIRLIALGVGDEIAGGIGDCFDGFDL